VSYLPDANGGHALHGESRQFTPPDTDSSEATDSQNHSLKVTAKGHDQVIKNYCCLGVEVDGGEANVLELLAQNPQTPTPGARRGSNPGHHAR